MRLKHLHHCFDRGVRTALSQDHAKRLPGHRLKIREKRAASDIGRKIKVHAPGRKGRLDVVALKRLIEPCARRHHQEPGQIKRATGPRFTPCFPAKQRQRAHVHRAAQQVKDGFGVCGKCICELGPCVRIGIRKSTHTGGGQGRVIRYAQPSPIGKNAGKRIAGGHKGQPMFSQFACVLGMKGRSGKQRQVHRGPIVPKTGQGIGTRLERTPRFGGLFIDRDLPSLACQVAGAGKAVMPCTNDNCVWVCCHSSRIPRQR